MPWHVLSPKIASLCGGSGRPYAMHMLPWAHPSPQPKRHFDWFSRFCTAHGRVSSGMPRHDLPPKLPLCMGICSLQTIPILYNESPFPRFHRVIWTSSNTYSLGPSTLTTQTASRSVQAFLHSSPWSVPKIYNGPPPCFSPLLMIH